MKLLYSQVFFEESRIFMKKTPYMSISQFANATGIKRANLIFYDRIGLLHPEIRSDNNYRYYTAHQLSTAYLISALRSIGISLDDIKSYANTRTPEHMVQLFEAQEHHIQEKIEKLKEIKRLMRTHIRLAEEVMHTDTTKIQIMNLKEETIFLGQEIKKGITLEEANTEFYDYAIAHNLNLSYPFGAVISKETLLSGTVNKAKHFYMIVPHKQYHAKPAGRYLVGYEHGGYGNSQGLHQQLLNYIEECHLVIKGDAYEEYPLNEMSITCIDDFLIRIQIEIE